MPYTGRYSELLWNDGVIIQIFSKVLYDHHNFVERLCAFLGYRYEGIS
jgi:hypothetical protein